jgi:hypothetical protein
MIERFSHIPSCIATFFGSLAVWGFSELNLINAWLQTISLTVTITIGIITLISIVYRIALKVMRFFHRPKP